MSSNPASGQDQRNHFRASSITDSIRQMKYNSVRVSQALNHPYQDAIVHSPKQSDSSFHKQSSSVYQLTFLNSKESGNKNRRRTTANTSMSEITASRLSNYMNSLIDKHKSSERRNITQLQRSSSKNRNGSFNEIQNYSQIMEKLQNQLSVRDFQKLRAFLASQGNLISGTNDKTKIQGLIKDLVGVELSFEDISLILKSVTQRNADQFQPKALILSPKRHIDNNSVYSQFRSSSSNYQHHPSTQSTTTGGTSAASTNLSRPFTCMSYVSSSTTGMSSSLTQKIERMNRSQLKLLAQQLIACRLIIEQILIKSKLTLKTKLTIPEMHYYLLQTPDLQSVGLSAWQGLLTAVMLIKQFDIMISFKSVISGCEKYINESDECSKEQGSKSQIDKIIDEIRDYLYSQKPDIRKIFAKYTESIGDQCDKVVMTREHFLKFAKHVIGEKHASKEIEQVYRNLVSKKTMTLKSFTKHFIHIQIEDSWYSTVGLRILREFMLRKRLDAESTFTRFLGHLGILARESKITKIQWRELIKRENLAINIPQMDCMFDKLDFNQDGLLDMHDWLKSVIDDSSNPLQLLREVIQKHKLTKDDILFRMKKKSIIDGPPLTFATFKECMLRLDHSLTALQLKTMFDQLSMINDQRHHVVELQTLIGQLTCENASMKKHFVKDIDGRLSEYIRSKEGRMEHIRIQMQKADYQNDGVIDADILVKILIGLKSDLQKSDIERYVRQVEKDVKGRINYQTLLLKFENVKKHSPLKDIAIRLSIFLGQNDLNSKTLLEKLIFTKNQSNVNKDRNKAQSDLITVNFFAKFLRAKVDKKRTIEELKSFVEMIDIDKDGYISVSDLDAFIGRANFNKYFEKNPISTIRNQHQRQDNGQLKTFQQLEERLKKFRPQKLEENSNMFPQREDYPTSPENFQSIVNKLREAMTKKKLRFPEVFSKLDEFKVGLVSYSSFAKNIDQFVHLSNLAKEILFSKIDKLKIGLISYEQLIDVVNRNDIALRLYEKDLAKFNPDSFEWEQNVIQKIFAWILDKRFSLQEAFKMMDSDFDGLLDIHDMILFLKDGLRLKINPGDIKLERLFKIMDLSKSGKLHLVDFEKLFTEVFRCQKVNEPQMRSQSVMNKRPQTSRRSYKVNWLESCKIQIRRYIVENYKTVSDSFTSIVKDQDKMKLTHFLEFIDSQHVLQGFSLTDQLKIKLFASLDFHRKGYLLIKDWQLQFGHDDSLDQLLQDFKRALGNAFNSSEEAWASISKNKDLVFQQEFSETLSTIIPGMFNSYQACELWKYCSKNSNSMSFTRFLTLVSDVKFRIFSMFHQSVAKHMARSASASNLGRVLGTTEHQFWENTVHSKHLDILDEMVPVKATFVTISLIQDKLRKILKSRGLTLKILFDGQNIVNLIEFNNIIKPLGMTSRELDKMYESIAIQGGNIDLMILQDKFNRLEQDLHLIEHRNKKIIKNLKEIILRHLNSVEDAFLLNIPQSANVMSLTDFTKLLTHLYEQCENKPLPNQALVKDVFELIDIKNDGVIDYHEWTNTFELKTQIQRREDFFTGEHLKDERAEKLHGYPCSNKLYSELLDLIGRNSKTLRNLYQVMSQANPEVIDFTTGVAIFIKYVRETLKLHADEYSDQMLQDLVKPFGEIIHGEQALKHREFTDSLRKRHFLANQATKNKQACRPKEIVINY